VRLAVGLVGCGYWGRILARVLADRADLGLAVLCDRDPQVLAGLAERYPDARRTTLPTEVMADPGLDAVVVATPAETHAQLALAALEQGKHLLVEKPLVTRVADAEALAALAKERRRVLMTDHTFLFAPAVRSLIGLVERGELGALRYLAAERLALGRFRADVDVAWDLAVHDVAVLDRLVGRLPCWVRASTAAFHGEQAEVAFLQLGFADGLLASLHANWLAPVKVRRMVVGGSLRTALWDDTQPVERLRVYEAGAASAADEWQRRVGWRSGEVWAPRLDEVEPLAAVVEAWVRAIRTGGEPESGAAASLRVVRVVASAAQSAVRHGQAIDPADGTPWRGAPEPQGTGTVET
jgi:predicted dehydrogenase